MILPKTIIFKHLKKCIKLLDTNNQHSYYQTPTNKNLNEQHSSSSKQIKRKREII